MTLIGQYYTFSKTGSTLLYSKRSIIHRYYDNKSLCGSVIIGINDVKYLKEIPKPIKFCRNCERFFNKYDDLGNKVT